MVEDEPIYMKYIRRSQERKRIRNARITMNISSGLKESIGYNILLRMGWNSCSGLGKNMNGRVSLNNLLATKKRKVQELTHAAAEEEYNSIAKATSDQMMK
ncbi:hypothetical protein NEFER03_0693 [Nematocida sp. LUAm3]|nr:hypothetical protein NEFER03_0693 [Nematocida sp. LUAm3]KAI5175152.1 hypothetical protein NEFER02_1113 [Nematocida sp. LUAm2]KAI5178176.1 hypothetical protein NEFER01_1354 [Nematocida sp. LUAm1]